MARRRNLLTRKTKRFMGKVFYKVIMVSILSFLALTFLTFAFFTIRCFFQREYLLGTVLVGCTGFWLLQFDCLAWGGTIYSGILGRRSFRDWSIQ